MSLLSPRTTPIDPSRPVAPRATRDAPDDPQVPSLPAPRGPSVDVRGPGSDGIVVERLDLADVVPHRDAWVALMDRALEPNVFLDPDFVLPAARHLGAARCPWFLLGWAGGGDGPRALVAVWPMVGRADPLRALASGWSHDLTALGTPLLDRDRAGAALSALVCWAGRARPRERGIVIRAVPSEGPTLSLLREAAGALGHEVAVLDRWDRAVLRRGSGRAGPTALSRKGAKEVRRQRRRLAECGTLAYDSVGVGDGDALRDAVERFLTLEAGGWKGAAGTALLASPGRTAFARTATRLLGRRGLCRVDSLLLDGAPVATALLLRAGDVEFIWKIAYREDMARFSPGVQLVLDLTEMQRQEGRADAIDSCAVPNHPMIDRLWRDRLRLCDVAVATRPGPSPGFRLAVAAERAARRLRAGAKRLVLAWRSRRAAETAPGV